MELKEKLQDYSRAEFIGIVEKIRKVDVSKDLHNKLVDHFDRVVKHPHGADLLFYPEQNKSVFLSRSDPVGGVLYLVKKWHNDQGQLAFSDDSLPQAPVRPATQPSAKERAYKTSSDNLDRARQLIGRVDEAKQAAENALSQLEALLRVAQARLNTATNGSSDVGEIEQLESELSGLSAARHAVTIGVHKYNNLDMTVKFAKEDAQRSVSYSHLDSGIQASILQQMALCSDQYLAQRPVFAQRQLELHNWTEAVIHNVEERLIRLATAAGVGPMKKGSVLITPAEGADAGVRMLTMYSKASEAFDSERSVLLGGIRSAVAGLAWGVASANGVQDPMQASVLSFNFYNPGSGEAFAMSIPLSELLPTEGKDWEFLAEKKAEVELAYRVRSDVGEVAVGKLSYGLKEITEVTHIYIASTNEHTGGGNVRVRAAFWDEVSGAYCFTHPGFPANKIVWTMGAEPKPAYVPPYRGGYSAPVSVPVVEAAPVIEDVHFDDCIVVFPASAGIEPLYVMFKGNREYPGAVSGGGQVVTDNWLQSETAEQGAAIPAQIADQLRGKVFKRFSLFRAECWKAIARTAELASGFSAEDLAEMQGGRGPFRLSKTGQMQRLEIQHVLAPERGGEVYSLDNMEIVARG